MFYFYCFPYRSAGSKVQYSLLAATAICSFKGKKRRRNKPPMKETFASLASAGFGSLFLISFLSHTGIWLFPPNQHNRNVRSCLQPAPHLHSRSQSLDGWQPRTTRLPRRGSRTAPSRRRIDTAMSTSTSLDLEVGSTNHISPPYGSSCRSNQSFAPLLFHRCRGEE